MPLIALLFGFLAIGVPIAFALAGAAMVFAILWMEVPLSTIALRLLGGINSFVLMAIPFFILAGALMNESGMTLRLVRFVRMLMWWMYGSLAQINVGTSMLFGGITGVAAADTAALGRVLIPAMRDDGYRGDYATALTVASGLVGPVIPPSVPMLVYGVAASTSIGALFLAGAVPGVLIGLALMLLNVVLLKRAGYPAKRFGDRPGWKEVVVTTKDALLALAMPVIIVGGIVGGIFTPTEASGIAVLYALVVGAIIYRAIRPRQLLNAIIDSAMVSAAVLLIVGAASLVGWVLAYVGLPRRAADWMITVAGSPTVFLLMVIVMLLVVGLFLEPSGALVILVPVLLPAALAFEVDPVHFGVVMVLGLVIGLATPPVGLTLFIGSSVGQVSVERLTRAIVPFILTLIAVLVIVAYVPALSLWLPGLLQ